ncbi:MAG: hypothetical protein H7641_00595 [Candidatus Heimdallarchaeota archaeon]|nr:hypothetical protein [Candidatus Heimdallarchaeota archaeon]MCK4876064.1 hypothetical protein [Candidatus Heimdallarchaeota archaeon]
MYMGKKIAITIIICFSFLVVPINTTTMTQTNLITENKTEEFGSSYLTIEDLNWTVGQQPRGYTEPCNYLPGSGYSYDINDTVMHFAETTGTFEVNVGAYANVPLLGDGIHVEFEARAIGGHIDSIGFEMIIYNNITKEQIYFWDKWRTGTLDSGFLFNEFTHLFSDLDDIVIFLGYGDGHSTNWHRECWFRELKIYNKVTKSDLLNDDILDVIPSAVSFPRGLVWYNDYLWNLVGGGYWNHKKMHQYNPFTGELVNNWTIGIFSPSGLAFDGTYYWISEYGSSIISKYNTSFDLVDSISTSVLSYGGLTFDGTNLWLANYVDDLLHKINKTTGSLIDSLPIPGSNIAGIDFDGEFLVICDNILNKVFQISPSDGTTFNSYNIPTNYSNGITLDSNKNVWITHHKNKLIYKLNLQISTEVSEYSSLSALMFIVSIFVVVIVLRRRK